MPLGPLWVDNNNPIISFVNGAIFCRANAGGLIAVHAWNRQIGDIDEGILSPFFTHNIDPSMAVARLRQGITREMIVDMLVLAGEETIITVFALLYIDDEVPFFHFRRPPFHPIF